jgi:hypothetical protein
MPVARHAARGAAAVGAATLVAATAASCLTGGLAVAAVAAVAASRHAARQEEGEALCRRNRRHVPSIQNTDEEETGVAAGFRALRADSGWCWLRAWVAAAFVLIVGGGGAAALAVGHAMGAWGVAAAALGLFIAVEVCSLNLNEVDGLPGLLAFLGKAVVVLCYVPFMLCWPHTGDRAGGAADAAMGRAVAACWLVLVAAGHAAATWRDVALLEAGVVVVAAVRAAYAMVLI